MKTGSWLALVVFAGTVGFLLGRGGPDAAPEPQARGGSPVAERGNLPPKAANRTGARTERVGRHARQRGESAEAFVVRMLGGRDGNPADPSANLRLEGMDLNRTMAAIFDLPVEAFPAVLAYARGIQPDPDPFADPFAGWDSDILSSMLARWTDLDPHAAMTWARAAESGPEPERMDRYRELICRETLRTDPVLAHRFLEDLLVAGNSPEVLAAPWDYGLPDPFAEVASEGESFESVAADEFFELLCREHPSLAIEAFAGAGVALQYDGQDGWITGVLENGLAEEALALAAGREGEAWEDLQRDLVSGLSERDPDRVEQWLEGRSGEDYRYVEHGVMEARFERDPDGAAGWYLSRATSSEDRASRVATLAEKQGPLAASVAWLERMEAVGEETGAAWARLVRDAPVEEAWPLLERVPASAREEVKSRLFKESAGEVYLRFGSSSESLLEPKPEELAVIRAQGREEEFQAYLREHNAKVAGQALEFLQARGLVELE